MKSWLRVREALTPLGFCLLALCLFLGPGLQVGRAGMGDPEEDPPSLRYSAAGEQERLEWADEDDEDDEEEAQSLRERLTEREDETRVEDPTVIDTLGRPLSVLGQYEVILSHVDQLSLGDVTNDYGQLFLEQEVELELFYPLASCLSLFAQVRLIQEEDLDSETPDDVSDSYVERGEMWLYAEEIAGLPLSLEVGRLNFEDDRLWWWDEDLDAVRAILETETFEIALAVAEELESARSDRSYIEPEHEDVVRFMAEISWDWSEDHAVQFFVLSQEDDSRTERVGDLVRLDREDESDADLVWYGVRVTGATDFDDVGVIGYWVDLAAVEGEEWLVSAEEDEEGEDEEEAEGEEEEDVPGPLPGTAVIGEVVEQDVRGWGLDAGLTWMLPVACEPRLTVAYAMGSGDGNPEGRTDRAFRQTGLHGNETGFGGVERFQGYGELLDPELSNLSIFTVGIGCTLFESSSIDLICHDYQLIERADSLRDARIEAELTGRHKDLGQGIDLILALEEWERIEFELSASMFRAGRAFGRDDGEWIHAGYFATRFAF